MLRGAQGTKSQIEAETYETIIKWLDTTVERRRRCRCERGAIGPPSSPATTSAIVRTHIERSGCYQVDEHPRIEKPRQRTGGALDFRFVSEGQLRRRRA